MADCRSSPLNVAGLKLIDIKNGRRSPDSEKHLLCAGGGFDLRNDMGGFDALFRTDKRAHFRFAEGPLREGCDD